MDELPYRQRALGSNWMNVVLGVWLAVSPFILGFTRLESAMWNNIIIGLLVLVLALMQGSGGRAGSMLNVLLGLWLVVSPFALDFAAPVPLWNNIIVGLLIAIMAVIGRTERTAPAPPVR
ncbi:MAG TPA: SPW repeat protein [Clostridia bacterium]|nr:SPW repeat protein [Clostridia bacterium]